MKRWTIAWNLGSKLLTAWSLVLLLGLPVAAQAQQGAQSQERAVEQQNRQTTQPYNNAPVWREVRSGEAGYSSLPGREMGVLIQSQGQTWREIRNGPLTLYGGIAMAIVFIGILIFYWIKGSMPLHAPLTGRQIRRFSPRERLIHWTTAITFVLLALTGLALTFGRHILVPVIGHNAFSWIAAGAKLLHNFVGPLFIVCVVALFFTFVRSNFWRPEDGLWVRRAGGFFSREHVEPASHRFNAGEKVWFWGGLSFMGLIVGISGLILDFPNLEQTRRTMQWAHIVHLSGALLFMIGALGHIYMGTIGMAGAYKAMRTGYVDETWAKEHHALWYEDIRSGKIKTEETPVTTQPGSSINLKGES